MEHQAKRIKTDENEWKSTINRAINAIVAIRFSQVNSFDTEPATTSEATGFVVDKTNGIILTNRHVVCAGPFRGEAIFQDHEEVEVHDFGFLKFDPKALKYMTVSEIMLDPANAKIGVDIRVVGNDAGEKLSILAGSLSRLDRNAPSYGELSYNDFNTFYLQAASSTSGGSSGSPVLNIEGNAVGLQAGGNTKAATDFYFPLDRVKRALHLIQYKKPVSRGTIQISFLYRPFDEVRRCGLSASTEAIIRKQDPTEIGMLMADTVLPEGPGAQYFEESDILISINDTIVTKFVPLEAFLDENVGKSLKFKVERGGEEITFDLIVQDLHSITPDRYLEIGGATLNNLSYQLARQFALPVRGVYVSNPVGMLRLDGSSDSGWIISAVDTVPVSNLDEFIEAVKDIPDRARVPITYFSIVDIHCKCVSIVNIDRHWSSFRLAVRNDTTGLWDFKEFGDPIPPKPLEILSASFPELDSSLDVSRFILHSLVKITMHIPFRIDGFPKSKKIGAGLVVDAEKGLVIVSRNVVPFMIGDVTVTIAESIVVPGYIEFLHPTHNIALISYDPRSIGTTPVKTAPISKIPISQGHKVSLVAFNHSQRPVCILTTVTDIAPVTIPPNITPRFRAINFDAISLDTPLASQCSSGAITDQYGHVQGIWSSFLGERNQSGHDNQYFLGFDFRSTLETILTKISKGPSVTLSGLAAEFSCCHLAQCREMGLSQKWVTEVERVSQKRQLLMVRRTQMGSLTATALKELDIILTINGEIITNMSQIEIHQNWQPIVNVVLIRDKKEIQVQVPTTVMDGDVVDRLVCWSGALLQEPHRAVLFQSTQLPSKVYVTGRTRGSPAFGHGIASTQWITHVNNQPTPTLTDFLSVVKDLKTGTYAQIKTISFDMVPCLIGVRVDNHYWPTSEVIVGKCPNSEKANAKLESITKKNQFDLVLVLDQISNSTVDLNCLGNGDLGLGDYGIYNTAQNVSIAYITHPSTDALEYFKSKSRKADILISLDWPANITKRSEKGKDIAYKSSEILSEIAMLLQPQYHFASGNGYFEREPYEYEKSFTRFIGLAAFGNAEKAKWFYAVNVEPGKNAATNSTLCPFPARKDTDSGFFFTDKNKMPPKGYVCKICQKEGHYINDCPNKETKKRKLREGYICKICHHISECPRGTKKIKRDSSKCWFCLSNPEIESHLIIAIVNDTYVTLAKGGIVENHLLIVPIAHVANSKDTSDIESEIQMIESKVQEIEEKRQNVVVKFEVYGGHNMHHLHVNLVPIPDALQDLLYPTLKQEAEQEGLRILDEIPEGPFLKMSLLGQDPIIIGSAEGVPFNSNIGRYIIASLLGDMDLIDWKRCVLEQDQENELAEKYRKEYIFD
ncbi:hypothetical protein HDV06_001942 [Boothiomyces sp. JEL0866]|nr:hypothetical protein HDV06_001942 [Boothiomyces sp. JEL0866]